VSKTKKTRPWFVKQKDDRLAYDHQFLPGEFERSAKWWVGESSDGCRLCTDYYGRKWDRRKQRHEGKKQAREVD
jgi:hypothetical protein